MKESGLTMADGPSMTKPDGIKGLLKARVYKVIQTNVDTNIPSTKQSKDG